MHTAMLSRCCLLVAALLAAPISANGSDGMICSSVADNLLKQRLSENFSNIGRKIADKSEPRRWVKYTEFCFDCDREKYVLASGFVVYQTGSASEVLQRDLFIATAGYFDSGDGWRSRRLSDIDRSPEAENDPLVKQLSRALLYLRYGETADRFFAATHAGTRLKEDLPDYYAIRGSNLRYWYACQSCEDVPDFTRHLSQDIRYTRIGRTQAGVYLVTTRPDVVVVEIRKDGNRYTRCPWSIGRAVEASSK